MTLQVIGFCRIHINAGTPEYVSQAAPAGTTYGTIGFDTATAPVDNGAGDFTLRLPGIAGVFGSSIILASSSVPAVASALQTVGATCPTADTIRITTLQEGAAGAVSALTDYDVRIAILGLPTLGLGQ